jgi:hypothetical protein
VRFRESGENGRNDRRNLAELNDGWNEEATLKTKKPLPPRPRIWTTLIGAADRAVDQGKIRNGGVLLKDLRVYVRVGIEEGYNRMLWMASLRR